MFSSEFKWCSHTVVLTEPGEMLSEIYFHMIDNLSTAFHALPMLRLPSLSVDELLLLQYSNKSTNFRSMSLNDYTEPPSINHMNSDKTEMRMI